MAETWLSGSRIKLFGRALESDFLAIDQKKLGESSDTSLKRLAVGGALAPARIYGFSIDGQYVDLARPAVFLVHGAGADIDAEPVQTGLGTKEPELLSDMKAWDYDRDDFLLRIDVEVGPLERILLEAELGSGGSRVSYGGEQVRLRYGGEQVRLRYSGQQVRGARGWVQRLGLINAPGTAPRACPGRSAGQPGAAQAVDESSRGSRWRNGGRSAQAETLKSG
jgi:hypothetical protein